MGSDPDDQPSADPPATDLAGTSRSDAEGDVSRALSPSHEDEEGTDPNNRRWWELWKTTSLQADYEHADFVQSRNITALLLVRDVLLILVTVVVGIVSLVVTHTALLWMRYPVQYEWYTSRKIRRNFVGASGHPDTPALSSPSFRDLTLNHTYPSLVPYLGLIGVRQYPQAMVIFLLWMIQFNGGNMDQRCMVGVGATEATKWLITPSAWPPPDARGGAGSEWAKLYTELWTAWSEEGDDPFGPTNPFFWLYPQKMAFCNSVLVNRWIDGEADILNTRLELGQIVAHGLVEWSRNKAEAGWSSVQMFNALFSTTGVNVDLSLDCSQLLHVADIQMGTEITLGVGGSVMLSSMMVEAASGPIGWGLAAATGLALGFFAIFGGIQSHNDAQEQAKKTCLSQYATLLGQGAYNNCVMFSSFTGETAEQICTSQIAVWTAWAKRLVPPPTGV